MVERQLQFTSEQIELKGTLCLPKADGVFPTILFIAGSGPIDRNENHKKIRINAFHDIAHYLAQHGIASFRYDKRGIGQSGGNYWTTGFYDNSNDAHNALKFLQKQKNSNPEKIFLLGHSEGALIATRLAGEGVTAAGIILLAGAAQSGEAILKWQALEVAKGLKGFTGWIIKVLRIDIAKAQQKQLSKIKQSNKDWIRVQLIAKLNAKWFREFLAYDPSEDFSRITVPVLAITGSKDIQVNPNDLQQMADLVKTPFEAHLIQNITHMLRVQEGDASISKYREEVSRPVEQQVLELVLQWIRKRVADG